MNIIEIQNQRPNKPIYILLRFYYLINVILFSPIFFYLINLMWNNLKNLNYLFHPFYLLFIPILIFLFYFRNLIQDKTHYAEKGILFKVSDPKAYKKTNYIITSFIFPLIISMFFGFVFLFICILIFVSYLKNGSSTGTGGTMVGIFGIIYTPLYVIDYIFHIIYIKKICIPITKEEEPKLQFEYSNWKAKLWKATKDILLFKSSN